MAQNQSTKSKYSRLNQAEKDEILRLKGQVTPTKLAERFNVSRTTIYNVFKQASAEEGTNDLNLTNSNKALENPHPLVEQLEESLNPEEQHPDEEKVSLKPNFNIQDNKKPNLALKKQVKPPLAISEVANQLPTLSSHRRLAKGQTYYSSTSPNHYEEYLERKYGDSDKKDEKTDNATGLGFVLVAICILSITIGVLIVFYDPLKPIYEAILLHPINSLLEVINRLLEFLKWLVGRWLSPWDYNYSIKRS